MGQLAFLNDACTPVKIIVCWHCHANKVSRAKTGNGIWEVIFPSALSWHVPNSRFSSVAQGPNPSPPSSLWFLSTVARHPWHRKSTSLSESLKPPVIHLPSNGLRSRGCWLSLTFWCCDKLVRAPLAKPANRSHRRRYNDDKTFTSSSRKTF